MDFTPFDRRGYPVVPVVTGYAEWANTYDATMDAGLDQPLLSALTSINWRQVRLAADLGCGTGRTGMWLRSRGVHAIHGVDLTQEMLDISASKRAHDQLHLANVERTPLPSSECDVCMLVLVDEANDESAIRRMVEDAVARLNQGDLTAIDEFWDENADYVGLDGRFIHGRQAMRDFFAQLLKEGAGTETATIEQVRFLASDLAIVDGSWIITGAKSADGKPLPVIRGQGCEVVQKKRGRWRFVATREMVVWTP